MRAHHQLGDDYDDVPAYEPTFADGGVYRHHTARKRHACEDCPIGRGIQPGERYTLAVGLGQDDRAFFMWRQCDVKADACRTALAAEEPPRRAVQGPVRPCVEGEDIPF